MDKKARKAAKKARKEAEAAAAAAPAAPAAPADDKKARKAAKKARKAAEAAAAAAQAAAAPAAPVSDKKARKAAKRARKEAEAAAAAAAATPSAPADDKKARKAAKRARKEAEAAAAASAAAPAPTTPASDKKARKAAKRARKEAEAAEAAAPEAPEAAATPAASEGKRAAKRARQNSEAGSSSGAGDEGRPRAESMSQAAATVAALAAGEIAHAHVRPSDVRTRGYCRFYIQGSCRNGDECKFEHVELDDLPPDQREAMEAAKLRAAKTTSLVLFYQYVEPLWTEAERQEAGEYALAAAERFQICGRLRVALEGFNGTLTGSSTGIRAFCQALRDWEFKGGHPCADTEFKFTDGLPAGQGFPDLKVFPVVELVNYGIPINEQPSIRELGGVHLQAEDYHRQLEQPNTVIIDVRNSYENIIGRFTPPEGGAQYIDPLMRRSTEFAPWLDLPETQEKLEGKDVMLICTGGIRCERASAVVRQKYGDKVNNVFQCKGGIENYLKKFKDDGGYWTGYNYTFDKRFVQKAEGLSNEEMPVLTHCSACPAPCNRYRNNHKCSTCRGPLLVCRDCDKKKMHKKRRLQCPLCNGELHWDGQLKEPGTADASGSIVRKELAEKGKVESPWAPQVG